MKTELRSKYLFAYYALLFAMFASWGDFTSLPGAGMRIAFFFAILLPVFVIDHSIFAIVMTFFITISQYGYSTSYMPAENLTFIVPAIALIIYKFKAKTLSIPSIVFVVAFFTAFVNLADSGTVTFITYTMVLLVTFFISINRSEQHIKLFFLIFIFISLYLAILQMTVGQYFAVVEMMGQQVVDRVGFQDINYGACVVSLGIVVSLATLFTNASDKLFYKILCAITIVVSTYALLSNASRGSVTAIAVPTVFFIALSKISFKYRLFWGLAVIVAAYYLLNSDVADYIIYRAQNESGTGTGRTIIWQVKLNAFFSQSNIFQLLFGWGYEGGRSLENSNLTTGFHNDFVAFLVEYGILGFFFFLSLFILPLKNIIRGGKSIPQSNKTIVIGMLSSLVVISFTLEPFAAGRLPFYAFWFCAYLISIQTNNIKI